MASGFSKINSRLYKEKFTFLLACLLLYSIAVPFFENIINVKLLLNLSFSAVLISALITVISQKKSLLTILFITLSCLLFVWLKSYYSSDQVVIIEVIFRAIFFGFMIFMISGYLFKTDNVSRDTISAALIGYLLLSLFWSNLYFILELLYPNSFTLTHEEILSNPSVLKYFSLVTISTLGYGDIAPVSSQAQNLSVLEALLGQIYMAVLVARLVGLQTAQYFQNKRK